MVMCGVVVVTPHDNKRKKNCLRKCKILYDGRGETISLSREDMGHLDKLPR